MRTAGEAAFVDPKGYAGAVNEAQAAFEKAVAARTPGAWRAGTLAVTPQGRP